MLVFFLILLYLAVSVLLSWVIWRADTAAARAL